ncbi:MAG: PAS domain-containing sensor histidine kinase, partial [Bacteroidota bacterium]
MNQQQQHQTLEEDSILKAVVKTATDGIIIINERGIMELANEASAKLFGYDVSEMEGQNVAMLMPEPRRSEHDQYIKNYQQTRQAKIIGIGREVVGQKKDGTTFPLRLSISEVPGYEQKFTGILHDLTQEKAYEKEIKDLNATLEERVIERTEELARAINKLLSVKDNLEYEVVERKSAEKELIQKEKALRKAFEKEKELNRLKSRFVSMASHEFRTPLSTILSSADLIEAYEKLEQQDKRIRHTNRIKSAVSNLTGILNDFLSLSKLEEGKINSKPVQFNLAEFCSEVLDDLQGLLKADQKINHFSVPEHFEIIVDKKMLKNILYNLLSNAIKYSNPGQAIDCSVSFEDRNLRIRI